MVNAGHRLTLHHQTKITCMTSFKLGITHSCSTKRECITHILMLPVCSGSQVHCAEWSCKLFTRLCSGQIKWHQENSYKQVGLGCNLSVVDRGIMCKQLVLYCSKQIYKSDCKDKWMKELKLFFTSTRLHKHNGNMAMNEVNGTSVTG